MPAGERTQESYWTGLWERGGALAPIDVDDAGLQNHADLARHRYLQEALSDLPPGSALLEIGAAQSRWLPYFHRVLGFAVTGLDYSAVGCERTRSLLAEAGVPGEMVCADLFDPPPALLGVFDVVASFGVVEHFDDTGACLAACARYLKPGGRMITTIPNMRGSLGLLQRWADRAIYDTHRPMSPAELAAAHREAGLRVVGCGYHLGANWRAVAMGPRLSGRKGKLLRHVLAGLTKAVWQADRLGLTLPPNGLTSPYVVCMAVKGDAGSGSRQARPGRVGAYSRNPPGAATGGQIRGSRSHGWRSAEGEHPLVP